MGQFKGGSNVTQTDIKEAMKRAQRFSAYCARSGTPKTPLGWQDW